MNIVHEKPTASNNQSNLLSTLDLIEHMTAHHQEQAADLAQLACWHRQQAEALEVERRLLAADVSAALREAEAVLR